MQTAQNYIQHYQLQQHPEGGWYKETYRSNELIASNALPKRFVEERSISTAIYFLLEQGNFSAFHRIKSDECWHFYAGQTLQIYVLNNDGELEIINLGNNSVEEERFQFVVPANCWFASIPAEKTDFSFVGCTVAPGFDFADFELAKGNNLIALYPQYESVIKKLCRQ
jgi:predicted cupin superfamily sugar epimerase